MTFDWASLEQFLVEEIVSSVRAVIGIEQESPVCRAAITDFYTQNMLVLWPTVAVSTDRSGRPPAEWRWHVDADHAGDEWASRVTAHAGSSGNRWGDVIDRFFDAVVAACRTATVIILDEGLVEADFVVVAIDDQRDLTARCLTTDQMAQNFPRLHRRDSAIRDLCRLPVEQQVERLLAGLATAEPESALDVDDRVRLLVDIGEDAAVAAAEAIGDPYADHHTLTRVIDAIGIATPRIVNIDCSRDCHPHTFTTSTHPTCPPRWRHCRHGGRSYGAMPRSSCCPFTYEAAMTTVRTL